MNDIHDLAVDLTLVDDTGVNPVRAPLSFIMSTTFTCWVQTLILLIPSQLLLNLLPMPTPLSNLTHTMLARHLQRTIASIQQLIMLGRMHLSMVILPRSLLNLRQYVLFYTRK